MKLLPLSSVEGLWSLFINAVLSRQSCRLSTAFSVCRKRLGGIMKQRKIETHKIGLIGQAPSRRGDPSKPLAGPNGRKIAKFAGMSYDELIACRRRLWPAHGGGAFLSTLGSLLESIVVSGTST